MIAGTALIEEEQQVEHFFKEQKANKQNQANLPSVALPSPLFFEGMIESKEVNLSTFAIDVDTASYTAARAEIRAGRKVKA